MEGFDRARVALKVGKKSAGVTQRYDFSKKKAGGTTFFLSGARWRGESQRSAGNSKSSAKELISSFTFSQPAVGESVAGEPVRKVRDTIGVLDIVVTKAMTGPAKERKASSSIKPKSTAMVSEKEVMKNGMGVSLAGDGKLILVHRPKKVDSSCNILKVPSLGLKIFVRDMSWMLRRCTVDAEGRAWQEVAPHSKGMQVKKPLARAAAGSGSDKPLKEVKKNSIAVLESIDLTSE